MKSDLVYLLAGVALLLAVVLPVALSSLAISAPIVLLVVGAVIGLLPAGPPLAGRPPCLHRAPDRGLRLVALMGVGLALDRPLDLRRRTTWKRWAPPGDCSDRMPLCIAGVGPAAGGCWARPGGRLLAAVLAPTDPVLAADVQVEGPSTAWRTERGRRDRREGRGPVRPHLRGGDQRRPGVPVRLRRDLPGHAGQVLVLGTALGRLGARRQDRHRRRGRRRHRVVARQGRRFRAPRKSLRLAETGEPLLAIAATVLAYGLAEAGRRLGLPRGVRVRARDALGGASTSTTCHAPGVERLERLLTLACCCCSAWRSPTAPRRPDLAGRRLGVLVSSWSAR